ncbi:protein EMSY-LIKE 3 [Sesamum angolense]|uniref:Protein EMSY-LIKE 3 n=1 Tax=Sesamum angolense TaxID=2727404 RepID=A0AAE1WQP4_9LAMI|nr:protein EMSY-LIKE 3 [Sesamum angolense]
MDYEPYDSSGRLTGLGTDDDFPPPHQNRMSRGGRISGNGRPAAMGSLPYPRMYDETDMQAKIHQLEQEAYSSVLRAFKAQDDALSWEWRQSGGLRPGAHGASQAVHEAVPSPSVSASRKKQKIAPSLPSQSFVVPSPFNTQPVAAANQPSSSAAKRGQMMGPKGKKHKSIPPGSSSMKMQYPPGPAGRGQFGNRISSGGLTNQPAQGGSFDPLVGRKVRTRWPDDNNFYEALITDYNPVEGRHALVYDIDISHWDICLNARLIRVTLKISPDDIQWEGEDPGISRHGGYGGPGHGTSRPLARDNPPGSGRGRGLTKSQSRKDFPPSQNGIGKKGPNDIQWRGFLVLAILTLEIEKAKKVLKEQELALTDALARLADLSDGESDEGGRFLHGQAMDRG